MANPHSSAPGDLHRLALHCSLPEALEAMGERWSFLLLRAAFNGLSHFEEFQSALGIARNILSSRLTRLTEHGILQRLPCADDRRRIEYRLTEKGLALLPVLVSLRQWGERWGSGGPANPVLVDARDRQPVRPVQVIAHDGRPLDAHGLAWVDRATPADVKPAGGRRRAVAVA